MEKLKPLLAGLKKHYFWILCGLIAVTVLYGWYSAYDEMPASFEKNKAKVASYFTKMDAIARKDLKRSNAPDGVRKKAGEMKGSMLTASRRLQSSQAQLLTWPTDFSAELLSVAAKGRKATWPPAQLAEYKKKIPAEVEKLRALVHAAESDTAEGIHWDPANFKLLSDQYQWAAPPTVDSVYEAQEKLWIIQSLLRCVAEINAPIKDGYNLPIYGLETVEVGPLAARNWTLLTVEGASAAPAAAPPAAPAPAPAAGKAPASKAPVPVPPKPAARAIPGMRAYPVRLRLQMDANALVPLLVALENQGLTLLVDNVQLETAVTLVKKEPPPAPPEKKDAPGAAAAAAPPVPPPPPVDLGPPQLVQKPRGTVVLIQATCYLADPGEIEALKVAQLEGLRR